MNIYWTLGLCIAIAIGSWHISEKYHETAWRAREAKINADAATKIAAANKRATDAERAAGVNLAAVDAHYKTKLQEKDHALTAARRDARANGMFVNAACPAVTRNAAGAATASPGISDGAARVRLSATDADFFTAIASEADAIVLQLQAAQAVIRQDRVTCGSP